MTEYEKRFPILSKLDAKEYAKEFWYAGAFAYEQQLEKDGYIQNVQGKLVVSDSAPEWVKEAVDEINIATGRNADEDGIFTQP